MSGFSADPDALRAQAGRLLSESQSMALLVGSLGGAGRAVTGDGGLDGLIAGLVDQLQASAGGAGMALEADGAGLLVNAANYVSADQSSVVQPPGP
jgi:hypothetical protein